MLSNQQEHESVCQAAAQVPDNSGAETVLIVDSPMMYWMSSQEKQPFTTNCREFARGSSILTAVQIPGAGKPVEATVFWGHAEVLAGECQYSQLMRTIFGNFAEIGFDATSTVHTVVPIGSPMPVHDPPDDLRAPPDRRRCVVTNVDLGHVAFLTEKLCSCPDDGFGEQLAESRLWNAKVQHVLMAGVRQKHPHSVTSAQRVPIVCQNTLKLHM
jgi:hypothetical protein